MEEVFGRPESPCADANALAPNTYVLTDIHGRYDLLLRAATEITRRCADAPGRVVFLGDYVDRGPQSREVVEFLMAADKNSTVTCLKGNHEDLMVKAYRERSSHALEHWLDNGGFQTMRSYGWDGREASLDLDLIPAAHIEWMDGLGFIATDEQRIYAHAGVMPSFPVHEQAEETCIWIRHRFLRADGDELPGHVVHGHTPIHAFKPEPQHPELLRHRTNLDTAAHHTGILSVGVFGSGRAEPLTVLAISADGPLGGQDGLLRDDLNTPPRTTREG